MDHSIRGYLGRQPTEILQGVLEHHLKDGVWQSYFYTVPMIIEVLKERDIEIPQEIYNRIAEIEQLQQEIATSSLRDSSQ